MASIKYNLNGTYPPYGVELRENNITGLVVQDVVVENNGIYEFTGVTFGDYIIVVYDTVGGIVCSDIINVSLTTTTTTTTSTTTTAGPTTTSTTTTTTLPLQTKLIVVGIDIGTTDSDFWTSTNSGQTFVETSTSGGESLRRVDFSTPQIGIAGGNNGTVWRTTNGGTSWTQIGDFVSPIHPDVTFTIEAIRAVDANTFLLSGLGSGNIYKSTNGGASWIRITTGLNTTGINNIYSFNNNRIIMGSTSGNNTKLALSTNGGTSWTPKVTNSSDSTSDFNWIDFNENGRGFAVGDNSTMYESTDSGNTWNNRNGELSAPTLEKIQYTSTNIVYIIGRDGFTEYLYKSTNGGTSFVDITSAVTSAAPSGQLLRSMDWKNDNVGWLMFNNGYIITTVNGGTSWTLAPQLTSTVINEIKLF